MQECINYLTELLTKLIDTLDRLVIVEGVSILGYLLALIIITVVLSNIFGTKGGNVD